MPIQSEMEPDYAPEWENDPAVKAAVNSTPREGALVRKMSPQEAMLAATPAPASGARTFQDALVANDPKAYELQRRGTGHVNTDRYAATTFGAMDAIRLNRPAYESIESQMTEIEESTDAAGLVQAKVQQETDEEVRAGLEAASASDKADTETLMGVYQRLRQWRMDADFPHGFERFTESQLSGLAALQTMEGQSLLQENWYRNYAEATAAKLYDAAGVGDKVWDFIKQNVGISNTVALADFTEKFDAGYYGSVINSLGEVVGRVTDLSWKGKGLKAYEQVYHDFWKQDVHKRRILFDQLNEHIKDIAGDNIFSYMALIQPFADKSSIEEVGFGHLMDNVTLAGLVPGKAMYNVVKFMSGVRKARAPIEILKRTGNMKLAADIINKALADENLARSRKISGMDKDELAWSAQAFDVSTLFPEQISGVAAEAARALDKDIRSRIGVVDQANIKITDPSMTPRRYYYDEAAKNAHQEEILGELNNYPNFARIVDAEFTTEKGSTYVSSRGKTTRNKAYGADPGPKPESESTVYVSYEDSEKILQRQAGRMIDTSEIVTHASPDVGLVPVERFSGGKMHVGHRITKVNRLTDDTGFTVEVEKGSTYRGSYDPETLEASNAVLKQSILDAKEQLEVTRRGLLQQYALDEANLHNAEQAIRHAPKKGGVKQRTPDELETAADEAFAVDDEAVRLRNQIMSMQEQIKRNDKILKDLAKPPKIERISIKYTFDQTGRFMAEEPGYFASKILSPSQTFEKLAPGAVDDATLAEFQESQILHNLGVATREARRGLTSKQLKDIDKLLLQGDRLGKVHDIADLINGVDTQWGRVQLDSTASIGAYYAERQAWDHLHRINNYILRRNLEGAGFKELRLKLLNNSGDPIKVFAKDHSERKTIPAGVKRIYDHKSGNIVDVVDASDIGKRLDSGEWGVVNFRHGQRFGDEVIEYGIVRRDKDLKPISGQVLNYRPGYVARQRPSVFYVVRRRVPRLVNGVKTDSYETARFFNRQDEAFQWKSLQKDYDDLTVMPDSALKEPSQGVGIDEEFDMLNFGGMYTGERSDRMILMGMDGKEAQQMSSYKALQLYQGHIANRYSSNELKMSLIGRFQNTYGDYLQNPGNWKSPLRQEALNDLNLRNQIENAREYINNLIRVPDQFQDWWAARMRSLGEAMEGKPLIGGKVRDWTMNFATRDPTAFIRAATFHQYLGVFNPSQVLVQGLGFATAMAAYPTKAFKILPQNMALSAAWLGRHNVKALEHIAASAGVPGKWLVDVVEEINQIGLFDSLKTSADYNAGINGISMSADALKRVMDAGLLPMRSGEMWARGYGYLLARDLFMKGKKIGYKPTQKEIAQIAKDANRFTLNLNRSNRAWWQKGLLSIPTQFYQVTAKFMENMIAGAFDEGSLTSKVAGKFGAEPFKGFGARKWSRGEKAKIMFGYLGMFGMAGVPFMDSAVSGMVNAYREATNDPKAMTTDRLNIFNNLPEELRVDEATFARAMRGGLLQVMAHWLTGSDPEIVSRVSIPAGIEDTIDLYKSGDRNIVHALGGAFAPGLGRAVDAAKGLWDILAPNRDDLDITDEERWQAYMETARVLSSTNNAAKSVWWHTVGRSITNKDGKRLFQDMDSDEWNSILGWQALGFSPAKVGWMYDLQSSTTELESRVTDRIEAAWTVIKRHTPDKDAVDSQHKRDSLNFRIDLLTKDLTPAEYPLFYAGIKKKILDDNAKVTSVVEEAIRAEATAGGRSTQGSIANPLLSPEPGEGGLSIDITKDSSDYQD